MLNTPVDNYHPDFTYFCKNCNYGTRKKSNINAHNSSMKHKKNNLDSGSANMDFTCDSCNKIYKDNSGLWRHKQKGNCNSNSNNNNISSDVILAIIKQNQEFKELLVEQNNSLINMSKSTNITNNCTINNSKTFNLNFFLNETCKDAMNIMDFVDSLQIQLSDLESIGELGFVNGLSKLIIKGLNSLEENERPVHCSDLKRETMYVKDEDKWEKEDDHNTKMKKALRHVARKNTKMIPEWKAKHPDCRYSTSHLSDTYNHIILESMGGSGDNDDEKANKIIKNISKEVAISKRLLKV